MNPAAETQALLEQQPQGPATSTTCCGVAKWCGIPFSMVAGMVAAFMKFSPYIAACHLQKEPLVPKQSNGLELISRHLINGTSLNFWDLPARASPELIAECNGALEYPIEFAGGRWGRVSATEAPELMYNCTKIPGLFEDVPAPLRGVFWMKGNGLPEELVSMQNGQWFPEERIYVHPRSYFTWGIAGGKPLDAPFGGAAYRESLYKLLALVLPSLLVGLSIKFDACPRWPNLPGDLADDLPGHVCEAGSGGGNSTDDGTDLTYGILQMHLFGNMSFHVTPDTYTLELNDSGVVPGSLWHRGIYKSNWYQGRCECEYGVSYELTKIIDEDGNRIEPYFSEWVEYMGDVPVVLWGDIVDETLKDLLMANRLRDAGKRLLKNFCAQLVSFDPFGWCKTEKLELTSDQVRDFIKA